LIKDKAMADSKKFSHGQPLRKPDFVRIADLKPGTKGHNLHLKVAEVNTVLERKRADGSVMKIAEALVGDSSGCILLTVRNEQIPVIRVGATVTLRNAKIEMFKGHMRLAVDRWGKIEAAAKALDEEVNKKENKSLVEYELVRSQD